MKYIKLILLCFLIGCATPRTHERKPYFLTLTIKGIYKVSPDVFKVLLTSGYKRYITYATNVDTLFEGKQITMQYFLRIN